MCGLRLFFKRVVARRAVYHTLNVITISLWLKSGSRVRPTFEIFCFFNDQ